MNTAQRVGVVIGRFQTPDLHPGHMYLISHAFQNNEHVLVLVGSRKAQPTEQDPLDYKTREQMILSKYPNAVVRPIFDHSTNEAWSEQVDEVIGSVFPVGEVILYGSRKSFIPHYSGRFNCQEVEMIRSLSGTELRNELERSPEDEAAFRRGMIYASKLYYPTSYQAIDVAILHSFEPKVLLGKKQGEPYLRFIGGIVDPTDQSLESTVRREVAEEAGMIEIGDIRYIGSAAVDDYRYRGTKDGIMTAFFQATYIFGAPKASDDIEEVSWQPLQGLADILVPQHQLLGAMLLNTTKN